MEGGPLLQDWWVELAEEFVPYLNIEARLSDVPDQGMLRTMGGRGFPHFVVLDDQGQRIVPGRAYPAFRPMNRAGTEVALRGARDLISARRAAAAAREGSAADAAILEANVVLLEGLLIEGQHSEARLETAKAVEGVDAQLVQRLAVQGVIAEYSSSVRGLPREDPGRSTAYDRASRAMVAVHREGTPLTDSQLRIFSDYWRLVFSGALLESDLELAETALSVYRRVYGTDTRLRQRVNRMTEQLAGARAAAGAGGE